MPIENGTLLALIKELDIAGIIEAKIDTIGSDKIEIVNVSFLTLAGALKNNQSSVFEMVMGMVKPGLLEIVVPAIDECEARSIDMAIYMDANNSIRFGGFKWDSQAKTIRFVYNFILPDNIEGFPDKTTLHNVLLEIYEGLLFHDHKHLEWSIDEDDLSTPEEKAIKTERLKSKKQALLQPKTKEVDSV